MTPAELDLTLARASAAARAAQAAAGHIAGTDHADLGIGAAWLLAVERPTASVERLSAALRGAARRHRCGLGTGDVPGRDIADAGEAVEGKGEEGAFYTLEAAADDPVREIAELLDVREIAVRERITERGARRRVACQIARWKRGDLFVGSAASC